MRLKGSSTVRHLHVHERRIEHRRVLVCMLVQTKEMGCVIGDSGRFEDTQGHCYEWIGRQERGSKTDLVLGTTKHLSTLKCSDVIH